jgi:hypothetical protein
MPASGFVPSEGVAALVLEPLGSRTARSYAHLRSGRWATGGQPKETIRHMLGEVTPTLTICTGNGAPCTTSPVADLAREIAGDHAAFVPPNSVAAGMTDTGALLHLILALSGQPGRGHALTLGTSGESGFAALLLELP